LRTRLETLAKELSEKEAARREARDALRDSERAISDANLSLARLEAQARQARSQSARLAQQRAALERSLADRRAAVEHMLVARYAAGNADALRAALSGDDPGAAQRTLYYVAVVSRATAGALARYRADLDELARLGREADAQAERLRALARDSRAEREKLGRERVARRRTLERTGAEIRRTRREIGVVRADEARLARLVERIGEVLARVEAVPDAAAEGPFSSLRGKLRLPVRGELTGRFGAPRGASGLEAKGVFIRAPEGQPVRAVARGQVVYADWMRGFGNLMIVDHGENYFSIYANTESLLKRTGDPVGAGETLATTGSSGGNEETGLYFELRHLGRPFDPLRWVKLK